MNIFMWTCRELLLLNNFHQKLVCRTSTVKTLDSSVVTVCNSGVAMSIIPFLQDISLKLLNCKVLKVMLTDIEMQVQTEVYSYCCLLSVITFELHHSARISCSFWNLKSNLSQASKRALSMASPSVGESFCPDWISQPHFSGLYGFHNSPNPRFRFFSALTAMQLLDYLVLIQQHF